MKYNSEELRFELGEVKDKIFDAINQDLTSTILAGLEIFEEILFTLIEERKKWRIKDDEMKTERQFWGPIEMWSEKEWITDYLRDIIEKTIRKKDPNVICTVIGLMHRIASYAFVNGDVPIFRQFVKSLPLYYYLTTKYSTDEIRKIVITNNLSALEHITEYIISPELERSTTDSAIERNFAFVKAVILMFNELVKISFDNKQHDDFRLFMEKLNGLFGYYERHIQNLMPRLGVFYNNKSQVSVRASIIPEQSPWDKHKKLLQEIDINKSLVRFGIEAWIVHRYDAGNINGEELKTWFQHFRSPGTLSKTWQVFLRAMEREQSNKFHWLQWESQERIGQTTYSSRCREYLQLLCCIYCLQIVGQLEPEKADKAVIEPTAEILNLVGEEDDRPINRTLAGLQKEREKWLIILGEPGFKAIPKFIKALMKAVKAQQERENKIIIDAALSILKIDRFKKLFLDAWKYNTDMRYIIKKYGKYRQKSKPSPSAKEVYNLGFNTLTPKEFFIDEMDLSPEMIWEQYGRGLARVEDEKVVLKLHKELTSIGEKSDVLMHTKEAVNKLLVRGKPCKPIVLIVSSFSVFREFEQDNDFVKIEETERKPRIIGYFKSTMTDIYYITHGKPSIIVVDFAEVGTWIQYRPIKLYEGEYYIGKQREFIYYCNCVTYRVARELLQRQQEEEASKGIAKKSIKERVRELRLQAHIRIAEQFEYRIENANSGFVIPVK